jgi:hypothetical protein
MSQATEREGHGDADQTGDGSLLPDPSAHLHQLHEQRHKSEGDVKVVITQRDSDTGGGKSTLAVWLALCWDQHGWDGAEKGTTDPQRLIDLFGELPPHSVAILDEAEELDARRAMKEENIEFSKKWMKARTRQIDSILTLPTTSALDVRMKELAHLRLHVTEQGRAKVYDVTVDDRTGEVDERFVEFYHWPDVSDTKQFQQLDQHKQDDLDGENDDEGEDGKTPKEVAERILAEERLEEFILTNNGTQRYLSEDAIGGEFDLKPWEAGQVKGLIEKEEDLDAVL